MHVLCQFTATGVNHFQRESDEKSNQIIYNIFKRRGPYSKQCKTGN
jgi:hypothetical protein